MRFRNLNRRNCPQGSLLVSVDLTSDEISPGAAARSPLKTVHWTVFRALRTHGGRQRFALRCAQDDTVNCMKFPSQLVPLGAGSPRSRFPSQPAGGLPCKTARNAV